MKMLKQVTTSILCLGFCLAVISCTDTGGAKSPADIERSIWEQANKGNFDRAFDIWFESTDMNMEASDGEMKEYKEDMKFIFEEVVRAIQTRNGGLAEIKVVEEVISEDGQTAKIKSEFVFADGTRGDETTSYVMKDGVWKIAGGF